MAKTVATQVKTHPQTISSSISFPEHTQLSHIPRPYPVLSHSQTMSHSQTIPHPILFPDYPSDQLELCKLDHLTFGRRSRKVIFGVAFDRTISALTSAPSSSMTPSTVRPAPTRMRDTGCKSNIISICVNIDWSFCRTYSSGPLYCNGSESS